MLKVLGFVFLMRCLLFVASFLSIPIEIVAVLGSLCSSHLEMVLLTNKSCRHFEKDTVAHFNFRLLYVRHYLRTPQRRINSCTCTMARAN